MAKHQVTMEVLSYHATAPIEEAVKLKVCVLFKNSYEKHHCSTFKS
jgi:hypothetical protein